MKPIEFKGANVVFAKDQPQYQPLPAMKLGDDEGTVITCWEPTDEEIMAIFRYRKIYLKQLTFNGPLQPVVLTTDLSDGISIT